MPTIKDLNDNNDDLYDEYEDEDEYEEEEDLAEETPLDMSDVELRIEEANCFKALLANPLFSNRNAVSKKVESKVREFIKQELRLLLGIDSVKPTAPVVVQPVSVFTSEEEKALKIFAQKILDREKNKPTVNPVQSVPETPPVPQVNVAKTPEVQMANNVPLEAPKRRKRRVKAKGANEEPGSFLGLKPHDDVKESKPKRRKGPIRTTVDGQEFEMDAGPTIPPPEVKRHPKPSFEQEMMAVQENALTVGGSLGILSSVLPANIVIDE